MHPRLLSPVSLPSKTLRHLAPSLRVGTHAVVNMKSFLGVVALVAGFLAPAVVAAPPTTPLQRDLLGPIELRQTSCNTPSNRACWSTGFNINTDYETSTPTTGVTRTVSMVECQLMMGMGLTSGSTPSPSPRPTTGSARMACPRTRSCW